MFRKLIMKSPHLSKLNTESRQEYGALLLLDQLMRYELPRQERDNLRVTVAQLEEKVAELKKGFFHSDEQDQELNYEKDELSEAREALSEVEKEMEENEHCRLNLALIETDDEVLQKWYYYKNNDLIPINKVSQMLKEFKP